MTGPGSTRALVRALGAGDFCTSTTVRGVLDGARISALEGREPLTFVKTTGLGSDLGGFLAAVDLAELFFGRAAGDPGLLRTITPDVTC